MRIHIITNLFAPDELGGGALFTDLAVWLRSRGHDVRVTCTFSYYPAWRLTNGDQGVALRCELYQGIPVRRLGMYVPREPTGVKRILSDFSFLISLVRRVEHPGWVPEIVLTVMPMLSQCLAQRLTYRNRDLPRLIVVHDFVVDAALELGMVRFPGFARMLHGVQRFALRSARTLLTISPPMLAKLQETVGPSHPTRFVPNWIHHSLQQEIGQQRREEVRRDVGRLFYAGNVGIKQGLPDFLAQFRTVNPHQLGWHLDIRGGGAETNRLKAEVARTPCCTFGPVAPERDYIRELLTCGACLVTQRPGVGANFLPSKLLPALATGTPVLAVCEKNTPLGVEISEGGFGEIVVPGDAGSLATTLTRWRGEPQWLTEMGRKALQRAEMYHRDRILPIYEEELQALVNGHESPDAAPR